MIFKVLSSNLLRSNFLEFFKAPFPNYTKGLFCIVGSRDKRLRLNKIKIEVFKSELQVRAKQKIKN